jgi:nicotinate-nucleotide adenylyltransferase
MAGLSVPPAEAGMRIGLFGGSFNPAHEGHRLVAHECLKRLDLDRVWILVTPGNPLKDHSELAPLDQRLELARRTMGGPQVDITGFEAAYGFTYTWQTLDFLTRSHPRTNFVWIMGADSMSTFDRWERWHDIARLMPMAIYARPGVSLTAPGDGAVRALDDARIPEEEAPTLAGRPPPAWVYLHGIMSDASSSAIRAAQKSTT